METSAHASTIASSETCSTCIFQRSYRLLIKAATLVQSPLLLAIRLYWGWQFFLSGRGKLINLDRTTGFFQTLHIPFPHLNAWIVGLTECFGGLLLLGGLGARLVGALLAFDMVVAYLTADIEKVKHIFDDPDKFVTADPFLFMLACAIVLAFGPGVFSFDWLLEKKYFGRNKTPQA